MPLSSRRYRFDITFLPIHSTQHQGRRNRPAGPGAGPGAGAGDRRVAYRGDSPRTRRTAGEAARQTDGAATRRARPPDSGTCRAAPGAGCARRGSIDRLRPTRRTALTAMVLDTSALTALLLDEPAAARLLAALEVEESRYVSAASVVGASLVVLGRFGDVGEAQLDRLLRELRAEVVPVDVEQVALARGAVRARTTQGGAHLRRLLQLRLGDYTRRTENRTHCTDRTRVPARSGAFRRVPRVPARAARAAPVVAAPRLARGHHASRPANITADTRSSRAAEEAVVQRQLGAPGAGRPSVAYAIRARSERSASNQSAIGSRGPRRRRER